MNIGVADRARLGLLLWIGCSLCQALPATTASGGTSNLPRFDLDGDGKSDLLMVSTRHEPRPMRQLLLGTGSAFRVGCASNDDDDCGLQSADEYLADPNTRLLTGDFNGDRKSDLLVIAGNPAHARRMLLVSDGATLRESCGGAQAADCGIPPASFLTHLRTRWLSGDFNGDRRTDLLVISGDPAQPAQLLLLATERGFSAACGAETLPSCELNADPYLSAPRTRTLTGDFDGDGRTDLLVLSGDARAPWRRLLLSNGRGFDTACASDRALGCGFDLRANLLSLETRVLTGNFDGDDRTDVLLVSGDPRDPQRQLLWSTGSGFTQACADAACGIDALPYLFHPNTRLIAGDFSGDGRTDILVLSGDPAFPRRQLLVPGRRGFVNVCRGEQDGACGLGTDAYLFKATTRELVGNFDGKGKDDLLILSGDPAFPRRALYTSTARGFVPRCISRTRLSCGLPAPFGGATGEVRELPAFAHNHPPRWLASSLGAAPDLGAFLNYAARHGVERIELDGPPGTVYQSGPLFLRSFQTLAWHPGVKLLASPGSFPRDTDSLLTIQDAEDVHLDGAPGATIAMRKTEYRDGEWRHAVNLLSARRVSIEDLEIRDSGGDGIYIGDAGDFSRPSEHIRVHRVVCDNNSRNGLSVVNVDGLEVTDSVFANTRRPPGSMVAAGGPQAGIDFEPNAKQQRLSGIMVRDVRIHGNENYGVNFALGNPDTTDAISYAHPVTIELERVSITGQGPAEAALNINYQAMTTIPAESRIDLDGVTIALDEAAAIEPQVIQLAVRRRAKADTCGFGVPANRKKARLTCRIDAGRMR